MPNVSLTNTTSQLAELQRRQKLADMLTAQSNEPFEVQSYKGIQAPISPYAGLAKVLQAYVGAKQASDIEKKRGEIGKISGEEFTNFMKNYEGTPEVRSDVKTVAASQPAPLAAPAAPPEMINTAKPFVSAGTPPQKMAQALQSSMGKGDIIASPQRIYGNAAPEAAPEAAVLAQARTNTPQEKMAMLMQGMNSGNPYVEQIAPAMYDEARKEEKSAKIFDAVAKAKQNGADPQIMEAFKAANDPSGAVNYLAQRGLKQEEAQAAVAAYKIEAADKAEQRALDRQARADIAAQSSADRRAAMEQSSADRRFLAGIAATSSAALGMPEGFKPTAFQLKELTGISQAESAVDQGLKALASAPKAFSFKRGLATLGGEMGESIASRHDTPEERAARYAVFNNVSATIKERAGTAQSKSEKETLMKFLPNQYDSDDVIRSKLTAYKNYLISKREATFNPMGELNPSSKAGSTSKTGTNRFVYNPKTGEMEPK